MFEQLGKALAEEFEDIEFIGMFPESGFHPPICTFNCLQTGATFCANTPLEIQKRLSFIRKNISPIKKLN